MNYTSLDWVLRLFRICVLQTSQSCLNRKIPKYKKFQKTWKSCFSTKGFKVGESQTRIFSTKVFYLNQAHKAIVSTWVWRNFINSMQFGCRSKTCIGCIRDPYFAELSPFFPIRAKTDFLKHLNNQINEKNLHMLEFDSYVSSRKSRPSESSVFENGLNFLLHFKKK